MTMVKLEELKTGEIRVNTLIQYRDNFECRKSFKKFKLDFNLPGIGIVYAS